MRKLSLLHTLMALAGVPLDPPPAESRPRSKGKRDTRPRVRKPENPTASPLAVHRAYTETEKPVRRRGLDGSLRSRMSDRFREIGLLGR